MVAVAQLETAPQQEEEDDDEAEMAKTQEVAASWNGVYQTATN